MRKLVIFGNGLGRALDNDYFQLSSGMSHAWSDKGPLENDDRKFLQTLNIPPAGPSSEDDLESIQLAQISCRTLQEVVKDGHVESWITEKARNIDIIFNRYINSVGLYYQQYDLDDFDSGFGSFKEDFVNYLSGGQCDVATLNYDTLLYKIFNEEVRLDNGMNIRLCNGFSGKLTDGYTPKFGFSQKVFKYADERCLRYYLHLHGSPLFVKTENGDKKLLRSQSEEAVDLNAHIVLSHGKYKSRIISESTVLSLYWEMFRKCLRRCEELIVFGYGGGDKHLNDLIGSTTDRQQVRVVQVQDGDDESAWIERFGRNVSLEEYENILEFREWDSRT